MYTGFFGLNEKPFTITPDPRYLFMSERHGEGLAHLVYGVTDSGGFIQLTGEVGTGKTTLVRTLLGQIPNEVDIALILNPHLTAVEFLTAICEELGIELPANPDSAKALVDALNRHLLDAHANGRRTILLVDEAQNLSDGVLEQLRLLTNLETSRQKLLQIILIAQPELREKLAREHLRQLAQRVTGRYHLEPLSRDETSTYIDHRMRVAGALTEVFLPTAKREVFRLSGGVPRLINVICDRALLGAYSTESRTVDRKLVRRAASEVSGQSLRSAGMGWLWPAIGVGAVAAAAWFLLESNRSPTLEPAVAEEMPVAAEIATAAAPMPVAAEPEPEATVPDLPAVDVEGLLAANSNSSSDRTLLELWGVDYRGDGGTVCEQAQAAGLSCYRQRGNWSTVEQLDRPVILTLIDSAGDPHRVALVGMDDQSVSLVSNGEPVTVPREQLADFWFGQFMLVWRPPNGTELAIRRGMRGDSVLWLKESIAALDDSYQPAGDDDVFDAELESRLLAFQRRHRIEADGLAGQKTQIIINNLLANDNAPRLSAVSR